MTVGILIPIPREFVLTAAASTLAGAELYVYENLTTTPVTLYSDRACTTPAANPIVSVAGFFPRRYMASAQLLTLTMKTTAGSTIHSDDYVDPGVGGTQSVQTDATLTTLAALTSALVLPQGRLTLTTAVPVTTGDVTAATTVYYTPYQGNLIPLYDGTEFVPTAFTELSQLTTDTTKSPAAVANNSNYDVFGWNDGGTIRATRGPAWSSDTARGTGAGTTELELVKGIALNKVAITNGPAANRGTWLGTIRSNGSAQINDSVLLRMVWNAYNRVARPVRVTDTTDSWAYTTATWRQARASTANQIAYVCGAAEDEVSADVLGLVANSSTSVVVSAGVGVDATNANSAQIYAGGNILVANLVDERSARYVGVPGLGYHFIAWLEISQATGTSTWYGDSGGTLLQSGLVGRVMA